MAGIPTEVASSHQQLLIDISNRIDPDKKKYDNLIQKLMSLVPKSEASRAKRRLSSGGGTLKLLETLVSQGFIKIGKYKKLKLLCKEFGNDELVAVIKSGQDEIRKLMEKNGIPITGESKTGNISTVRLVNGTRASQGRVEIYFKGQWGTFCGSYWDYKVTRVLCRTLGYTGNASAFRTNGYFGQGREQTWIGKASCIGNETDVFSCNLQLTSVFCHRKDVGVDCEVDKEGNATTIRLVDGFGANSGRLEVLYNGTWGSVCDHGFGYRDAVVICRTLGFTEVPRDAILKYGGGTGPIWLDSVACNSDEQNFFRCGHGPWGIHDCDHHEDVGVKCGPLPGSPSIVRLVNGSVESQGIVEVFFHGTWSVVCNNGWDYREAVAVCHMLGYRGSYFTALTGGYVDGVNTVFMDGFSCGIIYSGSWCKPGTLGLRNCSRNAAGVTCQPELEGNSTTVRLVNGTRASEGRLEVLHDGEWGTVCKDGWARNEAKILCRMLGFTGSARAPVVRKYAYYGVGHGRIWWTSTDCREDEPSIFHCQHSYWGRGNCSHDSDVGIDCKPEFTHIPVRLIGGTTGGRVQVKINQMWGALDGKGFDSNDALVICRQLNMYHYIPAFVNGQVNDVGPVVVDNMQCYGEETAINECDFRVIHPPSHSHKRDVAVLCQPVTGLEMNVRLVGGPDEYHGRLEVKLFEMWGTVCDDEFNNKSARVVCRMLGYSGGIFLHDRYGFGRGSIFLDDVSCDGSEASISNCSRSMIFQHDCHHSEAVSMQCARACSSPLHICPQHSHCDYGTSRCVCDAGFELKNMHCHDINECANVTCPANTTCVNTDGGYTCQCPVGYIVEGSQCQDINECLGKKSCPDYALCYNSVGSYMCKCMDGYRSNGLDCVVTNDSAIQHQTPSEVSTQGQENLVHLAKVETTAGQPLSAGGIAGIVIAVVVVLVVVALTFVFLKRRNPLQFSRFGKGRQDGQSVAFDNVLYQDNDQSVTM